MERRAGLALGVSPCVTGKGDREREFLAGTLGKRTAT